jgi:prevent-host-death family protein
MKELAVYEAKTRLSELLAEVESRGEQVVITRRGQPVARLVPAAAPARRGAVSRRQQTADTLAQLQGSRISLKGPLKDLIAEGRD